MRRNRKINVWMVTTTAREARDKDSNAEAEWLELLIER
jgi:hypothetical protein